MYIFIGITHPALIRCGDVITTSLCTSQRRRRYVPNETPNNVSMERHQYVSVVRLLDVLLERCNHISKGCSNDVPSVCLHDVSDETPNNVSVVHHQDASVARIHDVRLARLYNVPCKSQIKHPKTLLWYVSTTSRSYFFAMPC